MTTETALVDRLRRGEASALAEAYGAYHDHVRGFARRLVGEAAADDVAQETFLALPSAIERFRGDAPLRSFLVSIAANHARHHARAMKRRRAAAERFEVEPPPSVRTPERDASRAELARTLAEALGELPSEQREAIVLCDVEERTAAEAAARIGVPEGTVRTRAFHGKRKLRVALVALLAVIALASAAYAYVAQRNARSIEIDPDEIVDRPTAVAPIPVMHVASVNVPPELEETTSIETVTRSAAAMPRVDADQSAYAVAHRAHFVDHDSAAALDAWDAYLAAFPSGRFALEASYNRAICLVRLGRLDEGRAALAPFAAGKHGGYRHAEAEKLLQALE